MTKIIGDIETEFFVIYNSGCRDPSDNTSYESCRQKIDNARQKGRIDQSAHDALISGLNRERLLHIRESRKSERYTVRHHIAQNLIGGNCDYILGFN